MVIAQQPFPESGVVSACRYNAVTRARWVCLTKRHQRRRTMDRCASCGKELAPEFCQMPRNPCPECGSTARVFARQAQDGLCVNDATSWKQRRPGVQSAAKLTDQGQITLTASGPSPRNEEDALEI